MMKTQLAREDLRLGGHCAHVGSPNVHGDDANSVCVRCCMFVHLAIIDPIPPKRLPRQMLLQTH